MDKSVEKIGEYISLHKYKFPNANLFVLGMNHAKSSDEDYLNVESKVNEIVDTHPNLVVLKEGIKVDEENLPDDPVVRRIFLALKYKLEGMSILAKNKQGKMQSTLFTKLENKGISVLNADANLSILAKELSEAGITAEYLEDSLSYKIGLNGDVNLEDLSTVLSEEDRKYYEKIEKNILIEKRNEWAANIINNNLKDGRDCLVIYGNKHVEGILENLISK